MCRKTSIKLADATWNPVIGCSQVSEGCRNCYSERMAGRFCGLYDDGTPMKYSGIVNDVSRKWTGRTERQNTRFSPIAARKPQTICVCSMGDLFHESVSDDWIDEVFGTIATAHWHRYMILTKRPERMRQYFKGPNLLRRWHQHFEPLKKKHFARREYPKRIPGMNTIDPKSPVIPHLALGVSIENQTTADERIPILLQTPAARRFVSAEPLLGEISLRGFDGKTYRPWLDSLAWPINISLVIVGGETGPNSRPMHPDWARSMRDQCAAAGVPFMFKQWGEYDKCARRVGKKSAGRLLDGIEHNGSFYWQ